MLISQFIDLLKELNKSPQKNTPEYSEWIIGKNVFSLLKSFASVELQPVYISSETIFLYSAFIPNKNVKHITPKNFLPWTINRYEESAFGYYWVESSKGLRVDLHHPYDTENEKIFGDADPLYYLRHFPRRLNDNSSNFEFNQKLIHASEAYWVESEKSYVRLNETGDYEKLFLHISEGDISAAFIDREKLKLFGHYTNKRLLSLFSVYRCKSWAEIDRESRQENYFKSKNGWLRELKFKDKSNNLHGSQFHSFFFARSGLTAKRAIDIVRGEKPKKYAKFITYDWKNKKILTMSCSSKYMANYFEKSNLPYETSPVFFKPEVLLKYKSDQDKYEIKDRSIHCRGIWSLQPYDINQAGQVFTYIKYLQYLPYEEQLYWKSFNEAPKAMISSRALTTDFEGQFWLKPDPLFDLKDNLENLLSLKSSGIKIFNPGIKDYSTLLDQLNYVVTNAEGEWKDEIIRLATVCVDPINVKDLKIFLSEQGDKSADLKKYGSIKTLETYLRFLSIDSTIIKSIIKPLFILWDIRSNKGIVHLGNQLKDIDRKQHFRHLLESVSNSISELVTILKDPSHQ